jgi:hypothetical protein
MTRTESLLYLFQTHGNRLTLGEMLSYGFMIGSKYTSRISDLRKKGYKIECEEHRDKPTDTVYTIVQPGCLI